MYKNIVRSFKHRIQLKHRLYRAKENVKVPINKKY